MSGFLIALLAAPMLASSSVIVGLISVPFFTGAIGWVTNWSGVWMLFKPLHFKGFHVPLLSKLIRIAPRKVQQIPGLMSGGVGWQGIIPSRAAKMGSLAVDKGIAKLGSPSEFYDQLEPEALAEHIIDTARSDMREMIDEVIQREHPALYRDLPPRVRSAIHDRVQEELPGIVQTITDEIGENIDHLLDIKLMVIRRMEAHRELANKIFQSLGERELKFITHFGGVFGFILGVPVAVLTELVFPSAWWLLPILGVLVGYTTNLVGIWMIFEPTKGRKILGYNFQGLFLKRQDEISDIYAEIIAEDIVTLENIGDELLNGPSSDRTRQMIEDAMRPAIDRAVPAHEMVRVAVGSREYDAITASVATQAVDYTMTPLADPDFNERQSELIHDLIAQRICEMDPDDFSEMLRTAMREDEWLLYLHGAVLGLGGGFLHLILFG